jgi:tetratricopeptide (TPR) repeat protein
LSARRRSSCRFTPPTSEQLAAYLAHCAPAASSVFWPAWAWPVLIVVTLVVSLTTEGAAAAMLPWVVLAVALVVMSWRGRRGRELQQATDRLQDMVLLRRHRDALTRAWHLLPSLRGNPLLHARTTVMLAHCLDHLQAYEAAIVGYDLILEKMPAHDPGSLQIQIHRAIAALNADRLTDGDDALRQLRSRIEPYPNSPISAGYCLAQLLQDVRTHHYEEALGRSDELLAQLRPLGVDAGYGHALVALCYHHRRNEDRSVNGQASRWWWNRATLLIPQAALLHRFPQLQPLVQTLGATGLKNAPCAADQDAK